MRAGRPILPGAERRVATVCGRSAQPRRRAVVEIGGADPVMRRTGAVAEVIEVGIADRLTGPTRPAEIVERGVPHIDTGARLGKGHSWNEEEKQD